MKMLLSPPVIITGVAIGAVLLVMNGGKTNASASSNGPSAQELSATVTMNQAALAAQSTQAATAASEGAANYAQDTVRQGQILGFLSNINNNSTVLANQMEVSQAGITNNQITQAFNLAADIQNTQTDLAKTYVAGNVAESQQKANVNIATINANAAKYAAQQGAISSIFGSVAKVATTAFNPAAGITSMFGGGGGGSTGLVNGQVDPALYGAS
jgi:hypothetical protein